MCAARLNSYIACHKRNECPVDGKVEARSNNGYMRFTAVSGNEGLVLIYIFFYLVLISF